MNSNSSNWQQMASRVRAGETESAVRLREELSPQMVRLVRRTLRTGSEHSSLDRQILAEADSVHLYHPDQPRDSEEMVQLVAQRICARLLQPQTNPFVRTHGRPETVGV